MISRDAIPSGAIAIALVYVAFFVFNALTARGAIRAPLLASNAAVALLGGALWVAHARGRLSSRALGYFALALLLACAGNTLLAMTLHRDPFHSVYLGLILIGAGGLVLVPRIALALVVVIVAGWFATAAPWFEAPSLFKYAMLLGSSCAVAFVLHRARRRTHARISELRRAESARKTSLERALAEAQAARGDLDRKVAERTAELETELAERRRVEAERTSLGDQLRQAQKMDAVGRLAGGIAHDFNNLLTVLRASLEVASQRLTHDPAADEALRDASDATDRATALTRGLLAYGRKQTLERAPVDASNILRGLERMLGRVASEKIRVVTEASWRDATVLADRGQIEQVLLNLALNACDAMPHGGTLRFAVLDGALTAAEARARGVEPGAYVRILVSDTGTGMDEQTKAALFEPFFTTKPVGRGTGLGLAVAHGIVTQHGGIIDVSSAPGAGSTFEVWLPRVVPALDAAPLPVSSRPPVRSSARETILVVEDEPGVRRATVRILESYGYHVLVASDGASALSIAAGLESIDLVVSDVVMPDLDGPAVVASLRERWPELKALFVSGYTADHFAEGSSVRADALLQKPYRPKELANAVRHAMYGTD
jgi:signal transduction histidine kinase/CheY-like chemotaxis protein